MKNQLDRQWFYRGVRKQLKTGLGPEKAFQVRAEAGNEYAAIPSSDPARVSHKGA